MILLLSFCLTACEFPAEELEKEASAFKRLHPEISHTYQLENKQMHFVAVGDVEKQPLIFIHGSPGSWTGWLHFLKNEDLLKDFYLIAVDRPGFGDSQKGVSEPSLKNQARLIFEVIKLLKLKKPILVGHSLGGPVIARMAVDYPYQVGGLVFVAASVSPELEHTKWFQYPAAWFGIRSIIPEALRVCNEEILALKPELEKLIPLWSKIKAQIAIIQGDQDELVPPANKDFLLQHLRPELITDVITDSELNHFVPWKRPDLIIFAIKSVSNAIKNESAKLKGAKDEP